jgi:hypothetical protein
MCCGALVGCGGETGEDTGDTEAGETAGEATSPPTTGGATTDGASGEYTAFHVPAGAGMYTRIAVRRASVAEDVCTTVVFTTPLEAQEGLEISTAAMWAAEYAVVQQGVADCLTVYQLASEPVLAQSGLGTVTWSQDVTCPPTVDIDVTVQFTSELTWAPAEMLLRAGGISVQGC